MFLGVKNLDLNRPLDSVASCDKLMNSGRAESERTQLLSCSIFFRKEVSECSISAPCLVQKIKILNFFSAHAWRLQSRRNKKCIAQFACKSRDESNEPN